MNQETVINQTKEYIRKKLEGESSGHDWWHIYRVWKNALYIGGEEKADLYVVQLSALLHDIADWKFHDGDDSIGPRLAREWLEKLQVEEPVISHVSQIIKDVSFKGARVKSQIKTLEGMVVQDADRLDAIGTIGIARTFAYGGYKGRELYNPEIKPKRHESLSSIEIIKVQQ